MAFQRLTSVKELKSKHGMVSAAHPLAAAAGAEMLKQGGNAVDAAVATALTLGVVDPANSGLGGYGGLAVVYLAKEETVRVVDFNTKMPVKAPDLDYDLSGNLPENWAGYKAISVPGVVAGLYGLSQSFGSLEWGSLFGPAVNLAINGFDINKTIADTLQEAFVRLYPETVRELSYKSSGQPLKAGEKLVRSNYGRTLERIAQSGPDVFYKGEIGEKISAEIQSNGGTLAMRDLQSYKAEVVAPVTVSYRDYDIYGAPRSGSFTMMQTLKILEGVVTRGYPNRSSRMVDLVARAMALAWRDRLSLPHDLSGDFCEKLLDEHYVSALREKVLAGEGPIKLDAGEDKGHTTHLSTADARGNMVALTLTHGPFWYGSGVTIPETGIIMNNGMALFSEIVPGAVALTNITPTIVLKNKKPFLTLGTPGARRIVSIVTNLLIDIMDYNMPLYDALSNSRFHFEGDALLLEKEMHVPVQDELKASGYDLGYLEVGHFYGPASVLSVDPDSGEISGGTDPRFEGSLAGL
ncbi:MAG: gamma-glutamyltransferase family protein [Desulfocucumaceae bacterium]